MSNNPPIPVYPLPLQFIAITPKKTTTLPTAFPLQPHLWSPTSPTSISLFLSYTRALLHTLTYSPHSLKSRRFELEAYIYLLHLHPPKYPWFRFAQQILGKMLRSTDPRDLEVGIRSPFSERLQFACGNLVEAQQTSHWRLAHWQGEREKRKMSERVREVVGRAVRTWFGDVGGKERVVVTGEMMERCEGWMNAVVEKMTKEHTHQNGGGHGYENRVVMVMGYPVPHVEDVQMHDV